MSSADTIFDAIYTKLIEAEKDYKQSTRELQHYDLDWDLQALPNEDWRRELNQRLVQGDAGSLYLAGDREYGCRGGFRSAINQAGERQVVAEIDDAESARWITLDVPLDKGLLLKRNMLSYYLSAEASHRLVVSPKIRLHYDDSSFKDTDVRQRVFNSGDFRIGDVLVVDFRAAEAERAFERATLLFFFPLLKFRLALNSLVVM